jgi:hypothetical protein
MSPDVARLFCRTSVSCDVLLISMSRCPSSHDVSNWGRERERKMGALRVRNRRAGIAYIGLTEYDLRASIYHGTMARDALRTRRGCARESRAYGNCIVPRQIEARRHTHFHSHISVNPILRRQFHACSLRIGALRRCRAGNVARRE